MLILRKKAYARAGLLGNPSDGYNGKTISLIIRNFYAEVILYEWDEIEIVLAEQDGARFNSVYELVNDVKLHGYYGGIRLIKATIKRFVEYCSAQDIHLHSQNFSVRYTSNIPRQVGLAGSSSIIVATMRCLMEFYDVRIPIEVQPSFVLSVEMEELGITGGLQDRVIQVYEGLVYMDFSPESEKVAQGFRHYAYEPMDPRLLPPVYIAWHGGLSEPTEIYHNDIGGRFRRGDPEVVQAMKRFAGIAEEGKKALLAEDHVRTSKLINENYDLRESISKLPAWQREMVSVARDCGASAKFAGSGGAIVGTYENEVTLKRLSVQLAKIGVHTIVPDIKQPETEI
jgi:glucuronokinase